MTFSLTTCDLGNCEINSQSQTQQEKTQFLLTSDGSPRKKRLLPLRTHFPLLNGNFFRLFSVLLPKFLHLLCEAHSRIWRLGSWFQIQPGFFCTLIPSIQCIGVNTQLFCRFAEPNLSAKLYCLNFELLPPHPQLKA